MLPAMKNDARPRRGLGTHMAHETLRERIVNGELAPGARLLEPELAAALQVSRTPVREALRLLEGEGLVQQRSTGGFIVAPLNEEDARQLYAVRAVLDGLAAREACTRWGDEDASELRRLVSQMELLAAYPSDVQRLGWEFHQLVRTIAGNARCTLLLEDMAPHFDRYRTLTTQRPTRRRDAIAEHAAILDAILARDEDGAERRTRDHIMAGLAAIKTITH